MNSKERVKTVFDFGVPDKVPIWEWIFWPETVQRWENEGLPKGVNLADYFNFDIRVTYFNKTLLFKESSLVKNLFFFIISSSCLSNVLKRVDMFSIIFFFLIDIPLIDFILLEFCFLIYLKRID